MRFTCLQSRSTILLVSTLHDVVLQEISVLLPFEYLILDLDWVSDVLILQDLLPRLDSHFVEHLVISVECYHHGLYQPAIKPQGRQVDEFTHDQIINIYYLSIRSQMMKFISLLQYLHIVLEDKHLKCQLFIILVRVEVKVNSNETPDQVGHFKYSFQAEVSGVESVFKLHCHLNQELPYNDQIVNLIKETAEVKVLFPTKVADQSTDQETHCHKIHSLRHPKQALAHSYCAQQLQYAAQYTQTLVWLHLDYPLSLIDPL